MEVNKLRNAWQEEYKGKGQSGHNIGHHQAQSTHASYFEKKPVEREPDIDFSLNAHLVFSPAEPSESPYYTWERVESYGEKKLWVKIFHSHQQAEGKGSKKAKIKINFLTPILHYILTFINTQLDSLLKRKKGHSNVKSTTTKS